ncbi:MAG: hypothetical protein ACFE0I_09670 [Elainellaceae cyanobacterium]
MKRFSLKALLRRWRHEPPLGWAQLSHQKVRLLVALSGIAFADILIFMQLGFKNLLYDGSTLVHRNLQGDLVLISNRADFLGDGQTFSRRYLYQAAAVEGVESASPLYYSWAAWVNPWDKEVTEVAVIAFDPVQPVLDLPEVNQQVDAIKLSNIVLFDRQSQPTTGPVAESLTQGKTITMGYSDQRLLIVVFQEGILLAIFGFIPGFGFSIGMYGLLGSLTRIPLVILMLIWISFQAKS